MCPGKGEIGKIMIKVGGKPGSGGVTALASRTIPTAMDIISRVTGVTIGRCAQINAPQVAGFTGSTNVSPGELERSKVMIK
jgi:hypothetical protein